MTGLRAAIAAYCIDAPGSAEPRATHMKAHLAQVEAVMDKLLIAGPLKDESGAVIGSLIVFGVDTLAEAQALLDQDPYSGAGVWKEVRLERFIPVAGTLVGGRNW
jgi:uncharacterized protein YciI